MLTKHLRSLCLQKNLAMACQETFVFYASVNVFGLFILQHFSEFYEEALALIYSLTSTRISPDLWKCFEMMYQVCTWL